MPGEYIKRIVGKDEEKLVLKNVSDTIMAVFDEKNGAHLVLTWAYELSRPATKESIALALLLLKENDNKFKRLSEVGTFSNMLDTYKNKKGK